MLGLCHIDLKVKVKVKPAVDVASRNGKLESFSEVFDLTPQQVSVPYSVL